MDDTFTLYDLKVEVVAGDRPMVCSHKVGTISWYRRKPGVSEGNIVFHVFPERHPAASSGKERPLDPNDWMLSDAEIACPDPNCGARFKITRVGKRIQSHGQCTVVPLMRPDAGKYHEN